MYRILNNYPNAHARSYKINFTNQFLLQYLNKLYICLKQVSLQLPRIFQPIENTIKVFKIHVIKKITCSGARPMKDTGSNRVSITFQIGSK